MMLLLPTLLAALAIFAYAVLGTAQSDLNFRRVSRRPEIRSFPKAPARPHFSSPARTKTCVVPSNATDAAPAILAAAKSCNNGGTVVFSAGTNYTIGTRLDLTFLDGVDIDIQGNIQFTNDLTYWESNGFNLTYQNASTFWMIGGRDVNIFGGGTLDGNGQVWYDAYAENDLILRPILLAIVGLEDGSVSDINMRFSPQWYNVIINSTGVIYSNITIAGASTSENTAKNTDGWDVYRSDSITIQNSVIENGDDCVSFKPNSTNVVVQSLQCTGSHGISVGSLGQYPTEFDIVQNIYVYNNSLTDASDGARIKIWPGSAAALSPDLQGGGGSGFVANVTYDTMIVNNVDYAIELTQCYGQKNATLCNMFPSNMTISDIWFKNFVGTTSTKNGQEVGSIICSSPTVCSDIYAVNISVSDSDGTDPFYTCTNVNTSLLALPCETKDL